MRIPSVALPFALVLAASGCAGWQQIPWVSTSLLGDFYFAGK